MGNLPALLGGGATLALVGLAEGLSAARLFASRGGYRIDTDQDLLAFGVANLGSGVFGGVGVSGSLSKTAAVSDARCRTQMAGITAAVLSLVVILAVAPALAGLPKAVLSAIVVNAVWKLMDVAPVRLASSPGGGPCRDPGRDRPGRAARRGAAGGDRA